MITHDATGHKAVEAPITQWTQSKAGSFSTPQLGKELVRKPLILDILGPLQGKTLLEIGCGSGYWCRELAARGALVTGVDLADEQLRLAIAAEESRPLGITYFKRDGAALTGVPDGAFDYVFLDYVLLEIGRAATLRGIFEQAFRVAKPGGRLVVSDLHPFDALVDDQIVLPPGFDYFMRGAPFIARGRQMDGTTIEFTDYHWTMSDYFEAITRAGFRVTRLLEPEVSAITLQAHPELAYRARLPRDLLIVAEK